jgi:hypothetical protein
VDTVGAILQVALKAQLVLVQTELEAAVAGAGGGGSEQTEAFVAQFKQVLLLHQVSKFEQVLLFSPTGVLTSR